FDNVPTRLAVECGDDAHAAGIMFFARVIEPMGCKMRRIAPVCGGKVLGHLSILQPVTPTLTLPSLRDGPHPLPRCGRGTRCGLPRPRNGGEGWGEGVLGCAGEVIASLRRCLKARGLLREITVDLLGGVAPVADRPDDECRTPHDV